MNKIEFVTREQVDAWTTVQNIVDDVMNLWVSPITDPVIKRGIVGEVAPEAIMPLRMEKGQMILNEVALPKPVVTDDRVEIEPKQINRITREDLEIFRDEIDLHPDCFEYANALIAYQRIATKSAIYPGKGTPFGLMYAALGLAEAGEVQNKVKKAFRDDGVLRIDDIISEDNGETFTGMIAFGKITPERRAQIIKELGGVLWYIAAVCDEINATMSEVALTNLDELCGRGERNTLRGDGDDR